MMRELTRWAPTAQVLAQRSVRPSGAGGRDPGPGHPVARTANRGPGVHLDGDTITAIDMISDRGRLGTSTRCPRRVGRHPRSRRSPQTMATRVDLSVGSRSWADTAKRSTGAWPIPMASGARRPGRSTGTRRPPGAGRLESAVLPLVPRRGAEHLLQRAGPARSRRPGRPGRADLRQPGYRHQPDLQLRRAAGRVARFAGVLRGLGVDRGRPGDHLPADDPRGGDRDAGLRADRRGALGGVRRIRRERARGAHRRRRAEGGGLGVLRHRGQPGRGVQADPGPRHRPGAGTSRTTA